MPCGCLKTILAHTRRIFANKYLPFFNGGNGVGGTIHLAHASLNTLTLGWRLAGQVSTRAAGDSSRKTHDRRSSHAHCGRAVNNYFVRSIVRGRIRFTGARNNCVIGYKGLKRFVPKLWRRLLTSSSSGVVSGMLVPFFRRN